MNLRRSKSEIKPEEAIKLDDLNQNIYDTPDIAKREQILKARMSIMRIAVPIIRAEFGLPQLSDEEVTRQVHILITESAIRDAENALSV